ncbi:sensor histidine kinase [Saccharibacillus sp. CPCC 101409]|uniref:cache domain-containing sensor histidine kinase n=1 Tax=Saccharibacillus sp. CPCC 101409 TaxID=3058041 RepID=UPI002672C2CA|nr:sensor histidine kinase [Saccharibacillus sp. CPCC 101409]MDO3410214.1 sensor histidine kinase [Saccharibacillus sp. CPCC 101409]
MDRPLKSAGTALYRWLATRSLQSRLVTAYALLILIPSTLLSTYFYNDIKDSYIEDARDKSDYLMQSEKQVIVNQIETMERAGQLPLSDQDVQRYLTEEGDTPTSELVDFNNTAYANLTRILVTNPAVLHLRLYTANERNYEIWPIIFRESRVRKKPWFALAQGLGERQAWYFQPREALQDVGGTAPSENDPPKLSLLREINLPKDRHVGVVQVDMRLDQFAPRIFGELQEDGSQMLLVTGDSVYTRAQGGDLLTDASPVVQYAVSKLRGLGDPGEDPNIPDGTLRYDKGGEAYMLMYTPLERMDAYLLNAVSLEKMLQDVNRTRSMLIYANIGFILVLAMLTYIMNSFILKNLKQLADAMKRVRKGELRPSLQISGGGEIGELAHHFNKMTQTINELIAEAVRKQALMKEAELRTLYNQIDSHFLYNTLENIKMLAEIEEQMQISDALTSLGGMMRYNFKWTGEYVKLKDELRHIENYIEVMNIRFDEPVRLVCDIPQRFMELEILKMSLQPIVENSVKHAWNELDEGREHRRFRIEIREDADAKIRIWMTDDGSGIDPRRLAELNEEIRSGSDSPGTSYTGVKLGGIGLRNVHQRVRLFYGEEYGLSLESVEGQYTRVVLTIPRVLLTGGGWEE